MANKPKFLIAENPMAEPEGLYILHTQKPRFLAKLVQGETSENFEIVDEIDSLNEYVKGDPMKKASLMRRMGDWYVAYCDWEDAQMEDDDEY